MQPTKPACVGRIYDVFNPFAPFKSESFNWFIFTAIRDFNSVRNIDILIIDQEWGEISPTDSFSGKNRCTADLFLI